MKAYGYCEERLNISETHKSNMMLLTRIRQVLVSNLGTNTEYPEDIYRFPQSFQTNFGIISPIG
jgi:hypothetical protein